MKEKRNTPDLILIASVLALAGLLWLVVFLSASEGAFAVVSVEGLETGRYSLNEDGVYILNGGSNTLVIGDGKAWVEHADCPDKLCEHQGRISRTGQSIICLPNKVVITIEGAGDSGADFVL